MNDGSWTIHFTGRSCNARKKRASVLMFHFIPILCHGTTQENERQCFCFNFHGETTRNSETNGFTKSPHLIPSQPKLGALSAASPEQWLVAGASRSTTADPVRIPVKGGPSRASLILLLSRPPSNAVKVSRAAPEVSRDASGMLLFIRAISHDACCYHHALASLLNHFLRTRSFCQSTCAQAALREF